MIAPSVLCARCGNRRDDPSHYHHGESGVAFCSFMEEEIHTGAPDQIPAPSAGLPGVRPNSSSDIPPRLWVVLDRIGPLAAEALRDANAYEALLVARYPEWTQLYRTAVHSRERLHDALSVEDIANLCLLAGRARAEAGR